MFDSQMIMVYKSAPLPDTKRLPLYLSILSKSVIITHEFVDVFVVSSYMIKFKVYIVYCSNTAIVEAHILK